MCNLRRQEPQTNTVFASPDNAEARERGRLEQRLRRARAGAAADILTSPTGIPATAQLGGTPA